MNEIKFAKKEKKLKKKMYEITKKLSFENIKYKSFRSTRCHPLWFRFWNYFNAIEREIKWQAGRQRERLQNETFSGIGISRRRRFALEAVRERETIQCAVSKYRQPISNGIATRFQFRLNNDFHLSPCSIR